jgi:hypothetical protein
MYEKDQIKPDFGKRAQNPFRTPDNYFESLEDRIMGNIKDQTKKKSSSTKIIQFLKPALSLAASFALIFMLGYYSVNTFLLKDTAQIEQTDTTVTDFLNEYPINLSSIDDNSLINAIFTDETNVFAETNPDEFLAYLSSGLNEVDIYAEFQN